MKSNYKPLGKYIQPVVGRNNDLGDLPLVGLSIQKKFIPSIANTIGTDMSTYRIIEKNQFAYGPVTSRNGDKITIALFNDFDKALISQAYIPFEVKDSNELEPEYLMMWFRRPEFDRYARFKSHGSAREIFDWDEMCNTLLPVPSITKQKEIVKEYNVIQNRVDLNQQLIQKLEETAQAIYKQWFVEFEFPNENGNPYKSSGGEMVFNEELEKEIPKGWEVRQWRDIATLEYGRALSDYRSDKGKIPVYGTNGKVGVTLKPLVNSEGIIVGRKGIYRGVHYSPEPFSVIDTAFYLKPIKPISIKWAFFEVCKFDINGMETGSAIPSTNREDFHSLKSVFPDFLVQDEFEKIMNVIFFRLELGKKENITLNKTANLLLSKLATIER